MSRALVIDDDAHLLGLMREILARERWECTPAESLQAGLFELALEPFDAVFLDLWMPGSGASQVVDLVRRVAPDVRLIVCSGYVPASLPEGVRYLGKPFTPAELRRALAVP